MLPGDGPLRDAPSEEAGIPPAQIRTTRRGLKRPAATCAGPFPATIAHVGYRQEVGGTL